MKRKTLSAEVNKLKQNAKHIEDMAIDVDDVETLKQGRSHMDDFMADVESAVDDYL